VFARCARGEHDVVTSFGLCGIICAILLFPIGLIFLWWATTLVSSGCKSTHFLVASIQRKSVHDVECGYPARSLARLWPYLYGWRGPDPCSFTLAYLRTLHFSACNFMSLQSIQLRSAQRTYLTNPMRRGERGYFHLYHRIG